MASAGDDPNRPSAPRLRRAPVVSNVLLATVIAVVAEIMFFGGLVSAYLIAEAAGGSWPPAGQPRLPVEATALNSVGLLVSAGLLWRAGRLADASRPQATRWFLGAFALGVTFVAVQGSEWAVLLAQGLTLTVSTHAAFFYLIVGAHALHAIVALAILGSAFQRLRRGALEADRFQAMRVFWYFVVGLWPVLYWLVYL